MAKSDAHNLWERFEKYETSVLLFAKHPHVNEANLDGDRVNRWARHGSIRYLWKEAEVEAAIQYVVKEQGLPMSVFENKNRTFNMAI